MNALTTIVVPTVISIDANASDVEIDAFIAASPSATVFHSTAWCRAITRATRHRFHPLVARDGAGAIIGYLPLHHIRSFLFGDALVSTGFAVEGGILSVDDEAVAGLAQAAIALAGRLNVGTIELRGGPMPDGWVIDDTTNVAFAKPLAAAREDQLAAIPKRHRAEVRKSFDRDFDILCSAETPERQQALLDIPRKHRAEVRKALDASMEAAVGRGGEPRRVHYRTYAESVRNLGTPVFPARLFAEILDAFGDDADTLTVFKHQKPVSSVLTLYWRGMALPYWGGGTRDARSLRANERLYFELMDHARRRGMTHFDFGRSKAGSGPAAWKRNWGFEARPLRYARWHKPGSTVRDASAQSPRYAQMVARWQKLPLWLANLIGPIIARQLG